MAIIPSAVLYALYYFLNITITSDTYFDTLNAISLLSTFFLIGIEKIDYKKIRDDFRNQKITFRRNTYNMGDILVNCRDLAFIRAKKAGFSCLSDKF